MQESLESSVGAFVNPPIDHKRLEGELRNCCKETVISHAINNPMMMCQTCKYIIKCFKEDKAFRNYVRFCCSSSRKITISEVAGYKVIVFHKV